MEIIDPVGEPEPPPVDADVLPRNDDPGAGTLDAYGGFVLERGDSDRARRWGGVARSTSGAFVAELQRDLVALGHWISSGASAKHRGMLVDGVFGRGVTGAVTLFQRENGLRQTGKVDRATAGKMREKLDGDRRRAGHAPRRVPGATFVQLPPSPHYFRYGDIPRDPAGIVQDIWGTREMIDCIQKAAADWAALGRKPFQVGDISLYEGGYFPPHKSHRDGTGADITGASVGDIRRADYDKEGALHLARLFARHGARRILFNCKYVVDKCSAVKSCKYHHHHFHLDIPDKPISQPRPSVECKGCHRDVHAACDYAGKRSRI